MDRVIRMVLRIVFNRGLRSLLRGQTRKGPAGGPETPVHHSAREANQRVRETQRLLRRMGR